MTWLCLGTETTWSDFAMKTTFVQEIPLFMHYKDVVDFAIGKTLLFLYEAKVPSNKGTLAVIMWTTNGPFFASLKNPKSAFG